MNIYFTNLKTTIWYLALTIIIGSCIVVVAQPPWARGGHGGHGGPGGGHAEERFGRLLNLTDEQKAQIKTLREQAQTASKPYVEQIKPIREEMQKLIEAPMFDEASARVLAQRMMQAQTEIHIIQAKTEAAIYQLLTPEQKAKRAELHKAMQDHQNDPANGGEGRRGTFGRQVK